MASGEKIAYKGLTKAQLVCFLREFADKLEGISEKTADTETEDSTETAEVSEEIPDNIADAAKDISEETLTTAEDSAESAEVSKEISEKIADAAKDVAEKTLTDAEDSIEDEEISEEISGENIVIPDFDPENFQKLEMGIKKGEEGFSLKVKMKISHEDRAEKESPAVSGKKEKSRYKKIKKRMKASFKEISECMEKGTLPEEELVTSFLQDSRLMTSFSEYGAEFFTEYDKICAEFRRAFENRDMQACKTAYNELSRLKDDCHKRYKD